MFIAVFQNVSQRFAATPSRGLGTEFSPLGESEVKKKKRSISTKPAIRRDGCYVRLKLVSIVRLFDFSIFKIQHFSQF